MTKEQTIKHLKLMQSGARNAIRFSKNDKKISEEERKEDIEIYQDQLEALDMAIKALEQQTNDCMIFGTKENCFGGATENECEHCDYKIQKLEQHSEDCISRTLVLGDYDVYTNDKLVERIKAMPPVTPTFPNDATNGDMIKAMFPYGKYGTNGNEVHVYGVGGNGCLVFTLDWWNAPYKRGDEK